MSRSKAVVVSVWLLVACPAPGWALSAGERDHLLARLAFSPAAEIAGVADWSDMTREQAVRALLDSVDPALSVLPGDWVETVRSRRQQLPFRDAALARSFQRQRNRARQNERRALKQWWIEQILAGHSPVAERLLVFWHSVYATELKELSRPQLLWRQHLSLRQHLLGDYRALLEAMVHDPALLDYLDNDKNRRGKPNENFARELLELHTLGEGHYREADIRELARALTGAGVDRAGDYRFDPARHDAGVKTVFGQRSALDPEGVSELILRQPRAAIYPVERLWRAFVSDTPDAEVIAALAAEFRRSNFQLRPLLESLLLSQAFWAADNRDSMVQSPIEFVVDLHWRADVPLLPAHKAVVYVRLMGQDLFDPPDVAGWPGGLQWIDSSGLLARAAYRNRVLSGAHRALRPAHEAYLK